MSAKISDDLLQRLQAAEKTDPRHEIPVIVTVTAGADLSDLVRKGFKVNRVFERISAVSGTISAAGVKALAQSPQIEAVEFDGEMRAL